MEAAGFKVNEKLLDYYRNHRTLAATSSGLGGSEMAVELDPEDYVKEMRGSFRQFGDAAIWTISNFIDLESCRFHALGKSIFIRLSKS